MIMRARNSDARLRVCELAAKWDHMEIVPGVLTRETPVRQRTPSMDMGWRFNNIHTEFDGAIAAGKADVVLLDWHDGPGHERMWRLPITQLREIYQAAFARDLPDGHRKNPANMEYWLRPEQLPAGYELVNEP
jgi:hypothetical protein